MVLLAFAHVSVKAENKVELELSIADKLKRVDIGALADNYKTHGV